jgi:hypothetical protein
MPRFASVANVNSYTRRAGGIETSSPSALFADGSQGAFYDPSDFSTLFQNSNGTTPVTAVEQPVGYMADKSGRGNHATQATSASRPTLRARYNLLTYSEQFDNAAWTKTFGGTGSAPVVTANAALAPDNTMTADSVVFNRGAGNTLSDLSDLSQSASTSAGSHFGTVWLKAATAGDVGKQIGVRHVGSSTYTVYTLTANWVRVGQVETNVAGRFDITNRGTITADNTVTALVWGAQLLTAADQTTTGGAYQRIAAATDYATGASFPPYLAFDGVDDSMTLDSLVSGTSYFEGANAPMTWFAGATRNTTGSFMNLLSVADNTDVTASDNDFIDFRFPSATDQISVLFRDFTTPPPTGNDKTVVAGTNSAPATNVLTWARSSTTGVARVNGVAGTAADQTQPAIGLALATLGALRRGATPTIANHLAGRIYSLIVLGRTATAAELTSTETWINGKARAY